MVALLELKEKFKRIYGQYNRYIIPGTKFLITLFSMIMINVSIGFMPKLNNPLVALLVSVICAFLPSSFMILILSFVMLGNLYVVSAELAAVTLCLFLLMYLLFFRFSSKTANILILTAVLCWLRIPYIVPIAVGLTIGLSGIIPSVFGTAVYYIIKTASEFETAITNQTMSNSMQKFSFVLDSLLNNKQMIILIVASVVAIIVVYIIKRLSVANAWTYAIISGAVVQFLIVIIGNLAFGTEFPMTAVIVVIVGTILSAVVGYICQILFFSVDYRRTEVVQFEDDEYYYYVKAVPKINIVSEDIKVKRINAQKVRRTDNIAKDKADM